VSQPGQSRDIFRVAYATQTDGKFTFEVRTFEGQRRRSLNPFAEEVEEDEEEDFEVRSSEERRQRA